MIEELRFRQLKDEGKYQRQGGNVSSVGNEDGPVPGCSLEMGKLGQSRHAGMRHKAGINVGS